MEAKIVEVDDGAGNKYELFDVDGITFPRYFSDDPVKKLGDIREMPGRDDDVIIAAYPKAGTHWVWEMTNMLLRGSADYHPSMKEAQMMELSDVTAMADLTSPRVFNTHLRFRQLPKDMLSRKCKIIFVERNPKDMAVSRYCHNLKGNVALSGTFGAYLQLYIEGKVAFGSWFDYTLEWTKDYKDKRDYPICRLEFEQLKQDSLSEVRRLSEFLGFKYDDDFLQQVCHSCSFDNLKSSYATTKTFHHEKEGKEQVKPLDYAFRKGTIGDWKNWFTVAQNELFDDAMKRLMPDHSANYVYE